MIYTFVISLAERQDRRQHIFAELDSHGFDYKVWNAIKSEDGAQGLVQSVTNLLEYALARRIDCILIVEDDAKFLVHNPKEIIDKCMSQMPYDWDALYLGCTLLQDAPVLYSPNLIQLSNGLATHCILYSLSGMKKLLAALRESEGLPLDKIIREKVMRDGKCFCSFPLVATQITSYSDIQKCEMDYFRHIEQKFNDKTRLFPYAG